MTNIYIIDLLIGAVMFSFTATLFIMVFLFIIFLLQGGK
jgi:hypothetical protein